MRLGIDFGTTHTAVALVDRGNYPVIAFDGSDVFPSLVAAHENGELRYGLEAAAVRHLPDWTLLRSFKRLFNDAGPATEVELAGRRHLLSRLFEGFLTSLHRDLVTRSNAGLAVDELLEAAVSVPANASSAQRFLTLDAFARAGFQVRALLNEPSAAGFEYAHRYRSTITGKREYVAIYDLGGGTFDASLLKMSERQSEVVASEGVQRLGGDDFDDAILALVLSRAGNPTIDANERMLLLEECARQKEAVGPNTRRFLVDLAVLEKPPLAVPIDEIYTVCLPLVEKTLAALEPVLSGAERGGARVDASELAGIYVVGGAGAFPLVSRLLRERFGDKRVKRSPHPFAATAMGLAVFLDESAGYSLSERFSRTFGVFRESASGGDVVFDAIFDRETVVPAAGQPPLLSIRRYRAAHNIGHYRFVECSRMEAGRPDGDLTPWDEFHFPFDRDLRSRRDLAAEPVQRSRGEGPEVEETYSCAAAGTIEVTVKDLSDGFARSYRLTHGR
ncbi:MAG: Hsp70 family protein [Thermoanaerobaculia bacterium]